MHFASDNRAGVAPEVLDAIAAEAAGFGGAYGEDTCGERLDEAFATVFERPVRAFPVLTGTAANSLALACLCDPWGRVLCHRDAHILVDENGAPEFFGDGLRLEARDGRHGKLSAEDVAAFLDHAAADRADVHRRPAQALSLTNLTEAGTAYTAAETAALATVAHDHGLRVHLDGARFANAVVGTAASPAQLSWRAGVDVLSFGATKNGALAAEAVVFFDLDAAQTFERRRKRAGHLLSKMRFVSAQLLAGLAEGNWLRWAAHANRSAATLAAALAAVPGVDVHQPVDGNEVFVSVTPAAAQAWRAAGAEFYDAPAGRRVMIRLVTSFATTDGHIDALVAAATAHAEGAGREKS